MLSVDNRPTYIDDRVAIHALQSVIGVMGTDELRVVNGRVNAVDDSDEAAVVVDHVAQYVLNRSSKNCLTNNARGWKTSTMLTFSLGILMGGPRYICLQKVVILKAVLSFDCYRSMVRM